MFLFLLVSSICLCYLLRKLYLRSGNANGFLTGWKYQSIGHSPGETSISNTPKEFSVMQLQAYAVLVTSVALCFAMYAFHRRRRLAAVRAREETKEASCAQTPEVKPATQSLEKDVPAAEGDMMSIASSSSGEGELLNGGAGSTTPAIGSSLGSLDQAASHVTNRSRSSTVTTPATPKTPVEQATSTALTCPLDVASVGASGISSRLYPSTSRLSLPSSSGAIFGELLPACHQRSPVKFAQFFNSIEGDRFKKIAEGEDSEVFHVFTYKGDSVLKVQQIDSTPECLDRLLSKMTIASKLTELRKKRDYFTTCFVELRSVTCILDAYPEELIAARENAAGTPQQERRHVHQGQAEGAYLVWHMSYAGAPLNQIELESVLQLWSVLQQIALSLAVAEEALEFEHRALRLEHVLVKNTHEQSSHFFVGGRSFAVNTWGVEVHIAGYSSARITDGDSPVFTAIEGVPEDSTDRSLLCVYKHMASIIRDDWHAFLPLTNLLWVRHVTTELYRRYKTMFRSVTDHYEALAWSEIGSWRDQLLDYCSLGDFVEANFRADPLR